MISREQIRTSDPSDYSPEEAAEIAKREIEKLEATKLARKENGNGMEAKKNSDLVSFQVLTAAELDGGDYSVSYLVHGVLVEGQPTMFAAPSKSMKTTTCIDLAISLATGTKFLDQFTVSKPSRTLLMTGESGLATVQETARRIAESKGLVLSDVEGFEVSDQIPLIYDWRHLNALEALLDERKPDVLIGDPVYLMVDGAEAGNLFSMGKQLKPVADICRSRGITLILVHHAKQSSMNAREYQPLTLSDISWSGFAEFARQWFLLSRREDYEPGSGDHRLWFTYGGSAGHSGLWAVDISEGIADASEGRSYSVTVNEAREARKEATTAKARHKADQQEKMRQATLQARCERIKGAFRGESNLTSSKLKSKSGLSGSTAGEAIAYMVRIGELEVSTETIQGVEREVYSLIYPEGATPWKG